MKKSNSFIIILTFLGLIIFSFKQVSLDDHPTLKIGASAPDFNLKGVDGKMYTLNSFKKYTLLVVIFTCNHCPTAQAYEDRIIQLTKDYSTKGVGIIAIMPNDPKAVRLDELGYSDLNDTFEEMQLRSKQKGFNFPYLYDGDKQLAALAYGPTATPHVFIFNKERKLAYSGRFDDTEKPSKKPQSTDAKNAINQLLENKKPAIETTKLFGCSIKWTEKGSWQQKALTNWAKEPVSLDSINELGIKDLISNKSEKLRLINIWATWCGPCVTEFPEFITINRMYRGRDFELITITTDDILKKNKALKFLQNSQASCKNFIFSKDDKYKLIEAIDPKWQGALPYTILIEPGGKIVYSKQGRIDAAEMKKIIVDNPFIGRYF